MRDKRNTVWLLSSMFIFSAFLVACLTGCPSQPAQKSPKTQQEATKISEQSSQGDQASMVIPKEPIRIAFVPSVESGAIETQLQEFEKKLSENVGVTVAADVVLSYTAAVEQMAAGHFEAALIPPLAYVLANDRYKARVALKAVRKGSPTYRGQIIARVDSGINSIQDLKGKTFGFVEASSTSGFLYPKTLLINAGIDLEKDLASYTFAGSHPAVVQGVLSKRFDAGACFDDARLQLVSTVPNIMNEIKVVDYTPAIPGDTVTLRADCTGPFWDMFIDALMKLSKEGKEGVLYKIYEIEELVPANDTDYDPIRQMVKTLGVDIETELRKES